MFGVGLTVNVWLLLGFTVIFSLGELMRSPAAQGFVSKYAPVEARGQYLGAAGLQFAIGRFIAPVTVIMSAWIPPQGVFGVILLSTLISSALYFKLFQKLPESFSKGV
jgi:DHA1 family multidrug resistance protein B-like MFS transporter